MHGRGPWGLSRVVRCFLVAVAQNSSLDRYTNNFSLFQLLEQVRPSAYPARLAVYCHAFFEVAEEERGVDHETRIVLVGGGKVVSSTAPVAFRPSGERHRVRTHGLVVPDAGLYHVMAETRPAGSGEWTRAGAAWPLRADPPMH